MATIVPFAGLTLRPDCIAGANLTPGPSELTGHGAAPRYRGPSIRGDALLQEREACFFAYRVDYRTEGGLEKSRIGLVARLDPFGVDRRDVIAAVDAAPPLVEETVERVREGGMKTGFVVAGYEDPQFEVERILVRGMASSPLVVNLPGEKHSVWPIRNPLAVRDLVQYFAEKECVIVDGVHHFRAARRLRDLAREPNEQAAIEEYYPLAYLVNIFDFGVTLGAYQYLVPRIERFNLNAYVLRASTFFDVQTYRFGPDRNREHALVEFEEDFRIQATDRIAVGAYFPGEPQFFLFTLKQDVDRVAVLPPDLSSLLHGFSVVYLRRVFIEEYYFAREGAEAAWDRVAAIPHIADAASRAETEGFGAAFFLQPPTKRNLANLGRKGKRLPPGSVRLEPPPLCGLIADRPTLCAARVR